MIRKTTVWDFNATPKFSYFLHPKKMNSFLGDMRFYAVFLCVLDEETTEKEEKKIEIKEILFLLRGPLGLNKLKRKVNHLQ